MANMISQIRKIIHKQPSPLKRYESAHNGARPQHELPTKCDKICQQWRATKPKHSVGFNTPRVNAKSIPVISNLLPPSDSNAYSVIPPSKPPHQHAKPRFVADIYPLPKRKPLLPT